MRKLLVVVTTLTMLLSLTAGTAFAAKPKAPPATPDAMPVDDMPHPLGSEQAALRAQGLQGYLSGHLDKHGRNGVVQVRRGKFVELDRQGEDTIWTLLGEFGDHDPPDHGRHRRARSTTRSRSRTARVDNTTIWTPDFSQAYFEDLLFSEKQRAISMRNFYLEQSSGSLHRERRRSTDWVTVPYNEARYGTNLCGDIVCSTVWAFVNSTRPGTPQFAAGKTTAQLERLPGPVRRLGPLRLRRRRQLQRAGRLHRPLPVRPRRRGRGDRRRRPGRRTPSGAIAGTPTSTHNGPDGAGPHRLRRRQDRRHRTTGSATTPSSRRTAASASSRTSSATTSACPTSTTPAATPVAPRTRPASGRCTRAARTASTGKPRDGIGTKPVHMSAYEKLFLGWSNYEVVNYQGPRTRVNMGPAEYNTDARRSSW